MGNGEFQVASNLKHEWSQSFMGQKRYLSNKITQEWFQFIILSELKSDLHISHLIERSIYPIPRTPKIIILNDKMGQISILSQRKMKTLRAILAQARFDLQLFKIIRDIVRAFHALFQRFGPFGINEHMMGGNDHSEVIAWINQTFQLCQVQIELPKNDHAEETMIGQILAAIRSNSALDLTQDVFIDPPRTFHGFLNRIDEMIEEERKNIALLRVQVKNKRIDPPYPLSPRNNTHEERVGVGSYGSERGENVIDGEEERVMRKRYNIPKFLKKTKGENLNEWKQTNNQCVRQNNSIKQRGGMTQNIQKKYSVGKVRSLNVSPTSKYHSKYTHSFATTNYSLLSYHQYPNDQMNLSKVSSSKDFKNGINPVESGMKDGYFVRVHDACENEGKKQKGYKGSPEKQMKNQRNQTKNYSLKRNYNEITFQKQRTQYSYGSLNFHVKHLFQSKELCESKVRQDDENMPNSNNLLFVPNQSNANTCINENYSVVIHNQLQSIFGVEEEMGIEVETDIHEEFSRIIY